MSLKRRVSAFLPLSACLVLASGLCATTALFVLVSRLETRQEELRFREFTQRCATAIQIGADGALAALLSLNRLFAAPGEVSREAFHSYAQPLLQSHAYFAALGYQRIVAGGDREAYEKRMRLRYPHFRITEPMPGGGFAAAGRRDAYRVIEFVEPMEGNEVVFGLDSASMEVHNEAALHAWQSGRPAATRLFRLPQDEGGKNGFLVFLPIYPGGAQQGAGSAAVVGYNAAVFRADQLFARILTSARIANPGVVAVSVHELQAGEPGERVFHSAANAAPPSPPLQHSDWLFGARSAVLREDIDIAGRAWRLTVAASPALSLGNHAGSLLVLLLGVASSLSAACYLGAQHRRTLDLAHANALLNQDIAERRQVERALSFSEERFRQLVDLSSDWYWEQDVNYRFTMLAGSKVRQAPAMLEAVRGRTRWDMATAADPDELAAHRALVEAGQPFQNFEYLLELPGKQQVWLSVNGEPLFDAAGRCAGYRGTGRDITRRKRSEQALRELSAHRESIKEQERKRIAREIHDELGQTLLAVRLDMASLHLRTGAHARLHDRVGLALSQIDMTMRAVRNIINDLRPPVLDLGLDAAIEWQVGQFQRRTGICCRLAWDSGAIGLDERVATALFRIVQEALTNVLRHAAASTVRITLDSSSRGISMAIADNGVGAAKEKCRQADGFGLAGVSERVLALGGKFDILTAPGQGLTLRVFLPAACLRGAAQGDVRGAAKGT